MKYGLIVSSLSALNVALFDPRHERTKALSGLFDWVRLAVLNELLISRQASFVFIDPVLGELAVLDFL